MKARKQLIDRKKTQPREVVFLLEHLERKSTAAFMDTRLKKIWV